MQTKVLALSLGLWALVGCRGSGPAPVRIFAAASTRESVDQIATNFRAESGVAVEGNYAASSDLARQVEHGGDADLFISADEAWADYLADKRFVEQRRDLLANRLVVVVPADTPLPSQSLESLADPAVKHLALAGPAVPAGRYAREALRKAGLWERLQERVLDGGDVRAALTFVAHGEAEAGLVYATDAAVSSKVKVALQVPADLHAPIRYPLVLIRRDPIRPEARRLFEYLGSEKASAVFRRAGFEVIPGKSGP
jgi:molybdate transport system substrate-binding protein